MRRSKLGASPRSISGRRNRQVAPSNPTTYVFRISYPYCFLPSGRAEPCALASNDRLPVHVERTIDSEQGAGSRENVSHRCTSDVHAPAADEQRGIVVFVHPHQLTPAGKCVGLERALDVVPVAAGDEQIGGAAALGPPINLVGGEDFSNHWFSGLRVRESRKSTPQRLQECGDISGRNVSARLPSPEVYVNASRIKRECLCCRGQGLQALRGAGEREKALLLEPHIEIHLALQRGKAVVREDDELVLLRQAAENFSGERINLPVAVEELGAVRGIVLLHVLPHEVMKPVGLHEDDHTQVPGLLGHRMEHGFGAALGSDLEVLDKSV